MNEKFLQENTEQTDTHPALNPLLRLESFIEHIPQELRAEFAALTDKIKSLL